MYKSMFTRPRGLARAVLLSSMLAATPFSVMASSVELFFSEYVEGSGNNKALEIVNVSPFSVDLSAARILTYHNGSLSYTASMSLSGQLPPGEVIVVAHYQASSQIRADLYGNLTFNGDDFIELTWAGTPLDSIGDKGIDPGDFWGSGPITTRDHTLRRISRALWPYHSVPFDPAWEWSSYPVDSFDDLGNASAVPVPPSLLLLASGLIPFGFLTRRTRGQA